MDIYIVSQFPYWVNTIIGALLVAVIATAFIVTFVGEDVRISPSLAEWL